jgi:hypothetical protein
MVWDRFTEKEAGEVECVDVRRPDHDTGSDKVHDSCDPQADPSAEPLAERANSEGGEEGPDYHERRDELLHCWVDIPGLLLLVIVSEDFKEALHGQKAADERIIEAILEGRNGGNEAEAETLGMASEV